MKTHRTIKTLVGLNLAVIAIWIGVIAFGRLQEVRQRDAQLDKMAKSSNERGSLSEADFRHVIEIARRARQTHRVSDADLEVLLDAENRSKTKDPKARDYALAMSLGALVEVSSFSEGQTSRLLPTVERNLQDEANHPLSTLLAMRLAMQVGTPQDRERVHQLSSSPIKEVASVARLLHEKANKRKQG